MNLGISNNQLSFSGRNLNVLKNVKKPYVKPEIKGAKPTLETDLCNRDLAMDIWERTNGHPEKEKDVYYYLPNGDPLRRNKG